MYGSDRRLGLVHRGCSLVLLEASSRVPGRSLHWRAASKKHRAPTEGARGSLITFRYSSQGDWKNEGAVQRRGLPARLHCVVGCGARSDSLICQLAHVEVHGGQCTSVNNSATTQVCNTTTRSKIRSITRLNCVLYYRTC